VWLRFLQWSERWTPTCRVALCHFFYAVSSGRADPGRMLPDERMFRPETAQAFAALRCLHRNSTVLSSQPRIYVLHVIIGIDGFQECLDFGKFGAAQCNRILWAVTQLG